MTPSNATAVADALETRNLCIDTSEYVALRFAFNGPLFRRLVGLAAAKKINVFITSVIRREVESNIGEAAQDMANAVQQMKKKAQLLRDIPIPEVRPFFGEYVRDKVIQYLQSEFAEFLKQAQVEDIPLSGADAENVFELYFGRRAPFGTAKKKTEFPDAFIVASLNRWCTEQATKMYVITGDGTDRPSPDKGGIPKSEDGDEEKSMTSACHDTGRLIPLRRIAQFLDLITRAEEQARTAAVAHWASDHLHLLAEHVIDSFPNLEFVPDDFEAEVEHVQVLDVQIEPPEIVEIDDDRATLTYMAHVRYEATVHFVDPESGIWDSEDKVMLFQERHKVRARYDSDVEGELVVVIPPPESTPADASIEDIAAQIEMEYLEVTDTTVDVPLEAGTDSTFVDPAQLSVFDE